jgi:CRP-like cAMP-binding protein
MNSGNKINISSFWSNLFKSPAERSDLEDVLLSMPPFKNFSSTHLKNLMKITHSRVYNSGEFIFYQNDPGIALYLIRDGEVKIVKHSQNEEEIELARFGRGDFFGELALLDNDVRSASAVVVIDANIAVIFKPDLDRFIDKFPKRGNQILTGLGQIVATRLRKLDDEFLTLYNNSLLNNEGNKNG